MRKAAGSARWSAQENRAPDLGEAYASSREDVFAVEE